MVRYLSFTTSLGSRSCCVRSVLFRGGIALDVSARDGAYIKRKTPCPADPDRASMPGGSIIAPHESGCTGVNIEKAHGCIKLHRELHCLQGKGTSVYRYDHLLSTSRAKKSKRKDFNGLAIKTATAAAGLATKCTAVRQRWRENVQPWRSGRITSINEQRASLAACPLFVDEAVFDQAWCPFMVQLSAPSRWLIGQ